MKFAFSDKYVSTDSFVELCNLVKEYGFSGVEIGDAGKEKSAHSDSFG